METYGMILLIAMPVFVILILIEMFAYKIKGGSYNYIDAVSSLYSGMTNTLKDVLGLTIIIIAYPVLLQKMALFEWKTSGPLVYILTFIIMDFGGYWYHRFTHRVNYFWNLHIIHHSSEEYNLPCALRQQFASFTNFGGLVFHGIFLAILGVPKDVYMITAPIHLFLQFWYHTRLINNMGFLENILVTPSHHRVHHAMNDIYMDKNFSQIFIVWDKLFGTFQQELPNETPIYGVRRPARTWNPFIINFQHLWLILKDCVRTEKWSDKVKVWFMPTGWRPKDMEEKYPIFYVKDVNHFEKYNPGYSQLFQVWNQIQLISHFALLSFLFFNIKNLQYNFYYLIYGFFLLFSIFSYTTLMDKKRAGVVLELLKLVFVAVIILTTHDWFGLSQFWKGGYLFVAGYFVVSTVASGYFYFREFRGEELEVAGG